MLDTRKPFQQDRPQLLLELEQLDIRLALLLIVLAFV